MAMFMLLIIPLPFNIRRKMFTFMYNTPASPATITYCVDSHIQKRKPYRSQAPVWDENYLYLHPNTLY